MSFKAHKLNFKDQFSINCEGELIAFLKRQGIVVKSLPFSKTTPKKIPFPKKRSQLNSRLGFSKLLPSLLVNTDVDTIEIWDVQKISSPILSFIKTNTGRSRITDIDWCRTSPFLFATCSATTNIRIFDTRVKSGFTLSFPFTIVTPLRLRWHLCENKLACAYVGKPSTVKIFDVKYPKETSINFVAHMKNTMDLDWNPDNPNEFVSCSQAGDIRIWDIKNPQVPISSKNTNTALKYVKYLPTNNGNGGGGIVSVFENDPNIVMWKKFEKKIVFVEKFSGHKKDIVGMDWRICEKESCCELYTLSKEGVMNVRLFEMKKKKVKKSSEKSENVESNEGSTDGKGGDTVKSDGPKDGPKDENVENVKKNENLMQESVKMGIETKGNGVPKISVIETSDINSSTSVKKSQKKKSDLSPPPHVDEPTILSVGKILTVDGRKKSPRKSRKRGGKDQHSTSSIRNNPVNSINYGWSDFIEDEINDNLTFRQEIDLVIMRNDGRIERILDDDISPSNSSLGPNNRMGPNNQNRRAKLRFRGKIAQYYVDTEISSPLHYPNATLRVEFIYGLNIFPKTKTEILSKTNSLASKYAMQGKPCVEVICNATSLMLEKLLPQKMKEYKRPLLPPPAFSFANFSPSGHLIYVSNVPKKSNRMYVQRNCSNFKTFDDYLAFISGGNIDGLLDTNSNSEKDMITSPKSAKKREKLSRMPNSTLVSQDDLTSLQQSPIKENVKKSEILSAVPSLDSLSDLTLTPSPTIPQNKNRKFRKSKNRKKTSLKRAFLPSSTSIDSLEHDTFDENSEDELSSEENVMEEFDEVREYICGGPKIIYIFDLCEISISKKLAKNLTVTGPCVKDICTKNMEVCMKFRKFKLFSLWSMVQSLMSDLSDSDQNSNFFATSSFSSHSLRIVKNILKRLFHLYLHKLKDVQTVALLSCVIPENLMPENMSERRQRYCRKFYGNVLQSWELYCKRIEVMNCKEQSSSPSINDLIHNRTNIDADNRFLRSESDFFQNRNLSGRRHSQIIQRSESDFNLVKKKYSPPRPNKSNIRPYDTPSFSGVPLFSNTVEINESDDIIKHSYMSGIIVTLPEKSWSKIKRGGDSKEFGRRVVECSYCRLSLSAKGMGLICLKCNHGGHVKHMEEWFGKNDVCPTGCGCLCSFEMDYKFKYED